MKRYIKGLYMSLGMFSALPLPWRSWDDKCADLALPCLPLVGLLIGGLWWGAAALLSAGALHIMAATAILMLIPFIASGFLHLDGYLDTCDAVLSRRPLADKLRILKDPHIGAFAAIMLAVLFVMQFALLYAVIDGNKCLAALFFIPVISRCCVSLPLLCLKAMPQSAYANMFKENTTVCHKIFVIFITVAAFAAAFLLAGRPGLAAAAATAGGSLAVMAYLYKEFKGVSGDLAGCALVSGELIGLCGLLAVS